MVIQLSNGDHRTLSQFPDQCPFCHSKITPRVISGHESIRYVEIYMSCPNNSCYKSFVAYYQTHGGPFTGRTSIGNFKSISFSPNITSTSKMFCKIYNESYFAEQNNLLEICGVGYRKALEFLIKDYSKLNHPDKSEQIEKKLLAQCIKEYVTDERIKSVASRAVWLGNDETHYVRKWEGKNLEDLKKLIELTIHWIEMETLTKTFEEDMPS